jgi:hypothetical protein
VAGGAAVDAPVRAALQHVVDVVLAVQVGNVPVVAVVLVAIAAQVGSCLVHMVFVVLAVQVGKVAVVAAQVGSYLVHMVLVVQVGCQAAVVAVVLGVQGLAVVFAAPAVQVGQG